MLAGEAAAAEQAQAGLDLALQLLHLWCTAGKAELALAWISALISDSSGMQRLPAAAESRMTLGALFEGARPACSAFRGVGYGRRLATLVLWPRPPDIVMEECSPELSGQLMWQGRCLAVRVVVHCDQVLLMNLITEHEHGAPVCGRAA